MATLLGNPGENSRVKDEANDVCDAPEQTRALVFHVFPIQLNRAQTLLACAGILTTGFLRALCRAPRPDGGRPFASAER
jgi:hypothetical protein